MPPPPSRSVHAPDWLLSRCSVPHVTPRPFLYLILLQLAEHQVIECMEKITTAWRPEGEWIAKLDLVEEGSKLVVKEMDVVGSAALALRSNRDSEGPKRRRLRALIQ